jgi:hypothetical protein
MSYLQKYRINRNILNDIYAENENHISDIIQKYEK